MWAKSHGNVIPPAIPSPIAQAAGFPVIRPRPDIGEIG
jgi:hypothetical protein